MKTIKVRRDIIIASLNLIPGSMTIEDALKYYNEYGVMFYDSSLGNKNVIPKKLSLTREIILSDISTEEGKKIYEEIKTRLDGQG